MIKSNKVDLLIFQCCERVTLDHRKLKKIAFPFYESYENVCLSSIGYLSYVFITFKTILNLFSRTLYNDVLKH